MRGSDAEALGEAGGMLVSEVTGWVEGVHRAVADRVFRATGPVAEPVRLIHDGISRGVYATVRSLGATGAKAAGRVASLALGEDRAPLDASARGHLTLGAVTGIIGDRLEADGSPLVPTLSWRHAGEDVDAVALASRLAAPTGRIAVFVHGLCETEAAWRWRAERHTGSPDGGHPPRVAGELGFTPVFVRYNTGRHVSDNGADLDVALTDLVDAWPVPVERLVLIGHSMGGLVARSAAVQGAADEALWVPSLTDVVCLGTPHLGAPLERAANVGSWALSMVAESAPFSDLLNTRSAGIKDLRHGYTAREEWFDADPDGILGNRRAAAVALDGVRYHAIAATLGQRDRGIGANVLGDLLVPLTSATGRARRGHPVDMHGADHVRGIGHLDLLTHPEVTDRLVDALSRRSRSHDRGAAARSGGRP